MSCHYITLGDSVKMDSKKQINVGVGSSLIDLKAELLRKQQQLKSSTSRDSRGGALKSAKKSDLLKAKHKDSGKNKGVDVRSQKDRLKAAEEEKNLEKSKNVLEAKAKLYEKLQAGALLFDNDDEEDMGSATGQLLAHSLVNFQQKAIDEIKERKDLEKKRKLEEVRAEDIRLEEPQYSVDDDEWTEFTDSLGRTRKCLKTELQSYIERDEKLSRPEKPEISLTSADDKLREMKREKWELEAEVLATRDKVHYQDVLYDEVRDHGTGYYRFDRDEAVRLQQIRDLKKLSEQTAATREKVKKERSTKKSLLKAKLRKIKNKKRAKAGLPPLPEEDSEEDEEETDQKKEEENDDDDGPKKSSETRAWDFGKAGVFGPKPSTFDELDEKWLKDRRSDRNADFAPPTSLYSQGGLKKQYYNNISQRPSSSSEATSSSPYSAFSSAKYSNFVKSKDSLPSTSTSTSSGAPVVVEPKPVPFQAPQNFWKQRKDTSSSHSQTRLPPQKPIPIVDELPAPIPDSSEEFDRGRGGVEVAPPPTFEYYHGDPKVKSGRRQQGQSDEYVMDSVSSGLKALREKFEAQSHSKKGDKSFHNFPE